MRKQLTFPFCAAVALFGLSRGVRADSPIVINELMYHPPDSEEVGEYVELYNAGYGSVDLSGWRFADGITFTLPQGTVLDEGEYLVVCADQVFVRAAYGIANVTGNFSGTLDNAGERLRLVNSVGMIMDEVRYGDGNPWPAWADGSGYSLELRNPALDNETASSWWASFVLLGTPGKENSAQYDPAEGVVSVIKPGDSWRFFRGWTEASDPIDAWRGLDFPDQAWEQGPSGFGMGDGDDTTVLSDMQNNYYSVYVRKEFTIDDASSVGNLRLTVDYDDGFVAYLNGEEILRRGLGEPGSPVYFNTPASSHEAGTPESFDQGSLPALLRTGRNVLAMECHNESLTNGDLSLIPSLDVDYSAPTLLINEVLCEPEGWMELYSPSLAGVSIGGYFLTDDPGDLLRFRIPDGTTLQANGLAVFEKGQTGFPMPLTGGGVFLVAPDGKTVVDAFTYGQQYSGMSYGRYPDGSDDWYFLSVPTKGQPNEAHFRNDVIIVEIMYHPLQNGDEEYIELYNHGGEAVHLAGWEFTGAVRFAFPQGASIEPGEYLVVAKSALSVAAKYSISNVLGDYSGNLRNYGETLTLLDALGNPADSVHYADDAPWPLEADGLGPSLELMHPELDNSFGQLWAASDGSTAPEGTPGEQNSAFGVAIPPAIVQTRHFPVVPTSADPVTVTTRVIDDGAVTGVSLFFKRDGATLFSEVSMSPQGNGLPGDEVYEAQIPAQPDGTIVQFYIQAEDDEAKVSLLPSDAPTRTCLYLVDDSAEPDDLPLYRVLMTDATYTELRTRDVDSNVLLDGTFICGGQAWYNVGVRYRGYGSRGAGEPNMSYRVQFNDGEPFGNVRKLNLNGQRPASQAVGWETMRRVGMPYCDTKLAYLKLRTSFMGIRLQVESVDEDYLRRNFPEDSSGNLYRGEGHADRTGVNYSADFRYRGEDPAAYAPYMKQTNEVENDFTDIIHLCDVFTNTPDEQFEQAISEIINVEEWILYFAINTCFNNLEGAIYRDTGDDYYIYHHPYDDKWYILPWDLDTVLTDPTETIFRQTVPSIVRLLSVPRFRLMYLRQLEHLLEYGFSERQMFPAIDSLQGKFSAATLQGYKDVVTGRIADIRSQILTDLTIDAPEVGMEYIRPGDDWRFFRGKQPPSSPADAWKEKDFHEYTWESGPSGFGYGDGDDATELLDMQNGYFTVYIRKEFTLSSTEDIGGLELVIDYDDGFIAYLNGWEVARNCMGQGSAAYNTPATPPGGNHEAGTPEVFDISQFIYLLEEGKNVLAIEGHNVSLGSGDLSLIPTLRSLSDVAQNEGRWIVNQSVLTLTGVAPMVLADAVTVNGQPANYELGTGTWSYEIHLSPGTNVINVVAIGPGGVVDSETIQVVYVPPERRVADTLSGNITWTGQPSPYVVSRTVVVAQGSSLTIEPGTEVMLAGGQSLIVEGELIANGTEDNPIVFTRYRDGESWGSIVFDHSLASKLSHCVVEYSSSGGSYGGENYAGAVAVVGGDLDVDGCLFRKLPNESPTAEGDAIDISGGAVAQVRTSQFVSIGAGVHTDRSYVLVENCLFSDARGSGNDPVDVNGVSALTPVVRNNLIVGSQDDGVDMDGSVPLVTGNFIYSCAGKGISVGSASDPRIENNVIALSGTGIAVMDGSTPLIINNTIVNNQVGIHGYEKTAGRGGGDATVVNCILWGNGTEVVLDTLSSASVSYSDVEGASVWPGEGNINVDPRFADGANKDFRLTNLSACVDAGTAEDAPATDMVGNSRPRGLGFDMGAYESPYWLFVDTDGDNMPDGWEEYYFTGLAQSSEDDFDGDGMTNYQEYLAGTVPTDANSIFKVEEVVFNGGTAGLKWHAAGGTAYHVLASADLVTWSEVATVGPGQEREVEWFDNGSNGELRQFYRLEVLP